MDYLDRVQQLMESYSPLGRRVLRDGTRLIGHVPHVAPEAWLHAVYPALTTQQVEQIGDYVGLPVPTAISSFLQRCNGLELFSNNLNLYGLRRSYSRTGDDVWQPFAIETPNVHERPKDALSSFFFIGGYRDDGSRVYIDATDGQVHRCPRRSAQPLNRWPSFDVMLESEATRLAGLFDRQGRLIDPDAPTTPESEFDLK